MSGPKLQHQLFAVVASILMSAVAVGAAVVPASVANPSVGVARYV